MQRIFLLLLVIVVVVLMPRFALAASDDMIQVVSVVGKVERSEHEKGRRQALSIDNTIRLGDYIFTGENGKTKLFFTPDESIVTIGPKSRFRVVKYAFSKDEGRRESLLKLFIGKVRLLVPSVEQLFRNKDAESSYEIETPNAVAGIRGTYFVVDVQRQNRGFETRVQTLEGKVDLLSLDRSMRIEVPRHRAASTDGFRQGRLEADPIPGEELKALETNDETLIEEDPKQIETIEKGQVHQRPPGLMPPPPPPPSHNLMEQFVGRDPLNPQGRLPPLNLDPSTVGGITAVPVDVQVSGGPFN